MTVVFQDFVMGIFSHVAPCRDDSNVSMELTQFKDSFGLCAKKSFLGLFLMCRWSTLPATGICFR